MLPFVRFAPVYLLISLQACCKTKIFMIIKNEAKMPVSIFVVSLKLIFLREEAPKLEQWLKTIGNGQMKYMAKLLISARPRLLVEGAKSVIFYNYYRPKYKKSRCAQTQQICLWHRLPWSDPYKTQPFSSGCAKKLIYKRSGLCWQRSCNGQSVGAKSGLWLDW